MNFTIKSMGRYKSVVVTLSDTEVDLGLLDPTEQEELASTLLSAVQDLIGNLSRQTP